jgi:DNA-binding transcriptional MocR family regulator
MIGLAMTVPINGQLARIDAPALADLLGRWSQADGPLYRLLAGRLGRLADTGELSAGLRLPPERELADALSVSRNTVAMAYQLLRDDGMAESRQGSGTRVVPHRTTPAAVHRANGFFTMMLETSSAIDLTVATVDCAPQVAAALDDPSSLLSAAERRALTAGTGYLPYGHWELRAALAALLTSRHGLATAAEQMVVTTGGHQALDLVMRCELVPGQAAVVENPTFPGALDVLQRAGARLVGVPPGDTARLAAAVATHSPALVYLIPTHQNPVGSVMPAAERQSVVALARRHPDVMFIDDMTLAEITLPQAQGPVGSVAGASAVPGVPAVPTVPGVPAVPLAALAPDLPNLVTVGSMSKLYWGGLRTGWVRGPAWLVARVAAAKAAADLGSTAYQQGIVAALIAAQHDSIVTWRRSWAWQRFSALAAGLRSHLPSWTWAAPAGGLTIWARLPDRAGPADSGAFAQAALRRGVAVVPGRLLSTGGEAHAGASHVRLAFTQSPERLREAAAALADV